MERFPQRRSAFSLMELLAVVAIIGILAALILPRVATTSEAAREKTCFHNRTAINVTVERYFMQTGVWPADDLSDIAADVNYFPSGLPTCPVSNAPYRLDPSTHRVVGHDSSANHTP